MLQPRESVGLEYDRIAWLVDRLGPAEGELAIGAAMEDLAVLLHDAGLARDVSDMSALRMRALCIQGAAERLGMRLLAQVAGDVIALCGTQDVAALAATSARMGRVGEHSLLAVWDAQLPIE